MGREGEFNKKLLSIYCNEAQEHLQSISAGLLELEKYPSAERYIGIIEMVFRDAHSLKGASRAVNLGRLERICQSVETVFSAMKRRELLATADLFAILHRSVDAMIDMIPPPGGGKERPGMDDLSEQILGMLTQVLEHKPDQSDRPPLPPAEEVISPADTAEPTPWRKQVSADSVRISIGKMDSLLLQAEEMRAAKLLADQRTRDVVEILAGFSEWDKNWLHLYPTVRDLQRRLEQRDRKAGVRTVTNEERGLLEFFEWMHDRMHQARERFGVLKEAIARDRHNVGLMTDALLDDVRKIMMLPMSTLLEEFPKLVRDLSREQGKEVDMVIDGEEIEVDRRILEVMRNVMIHLLRNAVDHGIEPPGERIRKGKKAKGTIRVTVARLEENRVEVVVADDGAGFDTGAILEAARKRGIVGTSNDMRMEDHDALASLIYRSGVSTSPIITDISGRGLGLAIVKEKIDELGGNIAQETLPGRGASFRIIVPMNWTAFRGILLAVEEQNFIIPTANIERVVRLKREEVETVENKNTVQVGGVTLPLFGLGDILGLSRGGNISSHLMILIVSALDNRIAFSVDGVLSEQEVVVKPFAPQLSRVRNISGATILGSGKVVPILNAQDLIRSAMKSQFEPLSDFPHPDEENKGKRILVVEDSITSRMLLKNILESSGYLVKTSVDGSDGYAMLRQEPFDIVVSDVDMPRMNGFDLTAKIRGDRKLSEIPVVLVTSLDSREDRERGVDVGANAYIVKSSFDQSNLLEIVGRLI
ncbi:MAG: response regulator [Syntrophales bacterium]|nr:response regulator [Syntrophales bacterium]